MVLGFAVAVSAAIMVVLWMRPITLWLPAVVAAGFGVWALSLLPARRRDRWVRKTVVNTYELDGDRVGADVLAELLNTKEVREAKYAASLRAEAMIREKYRYGHSER